VKLYVLIQLKEAQYDTQHDNKKVTFSIILS
jgi:hypothetical protein